MEIVIWSKANCPQCDKAKALLDGRGIGYEVKTIGPGKHDVGELLALVPTAKSVPQVFIDGNHVGGYNELVSAIGE